MPRPTPLFAASLAALFVSVAMACGGSSSGSKSGGCVEGTSQGCVCTSGATGAQVCDATGVFGACSCTGGSLGTVMLGDGGSVVPSDGGTASDDGGPVILSLTTDVQKITENASITIVAVISDSRGLSNLAGGQLTSDAGTIGAFIATTQSTYSLTVTWAELNAIAKINFTGTSSLTTHATFFNAQGKKTTQDVTIGLYCSVDGGANPAACDGVCTDLRDPANCGTCGTSCVSWQTCTPGGTCGCPASAPDACSSESLCTDVQVDPNNCGSCGKTCPSGSLCDQGACIHWVEVPSTDATSCAAFCQSSGQLCVDGCPGTGTTTAGALTVPGGSNPFVYESCSFDTTHVQVDECCCTTN